MRSRRDAASRTSPLVLVIVLGAFLYLCFELVRFFAAPLGWDQCWLLYAAQHMLAGVELYGPRLTETNPPAIIWFSALPVLLSHALRISTATALHLIILAGIFASTAWCLRLSRLDRSSADANFLWMLGCAIVLVGFDIATYDFGQREQLFVYLTLPYIFAAGTGLSSRLTIMERVTLGLAAGLAICFKPQEVLVLVALEIYLLIRDRSLRRCLTPELLLIVATCSLYFVLIRLITPLYTRNILPLLLDTYWALGEASALVLFTHVKRYFGELLLAFLLFFALRRFVQLPKGLIPLLICSIGGFLAFDIQHTDWLYHRYPYEAFLDLAFACLIIGVLSHLIQKLEAHRQANRVAVLGCVLALVAFGVYLLRGREQLYQEAHPAPDALGRYLAQYKPGETVYVFSTSLPSFADVYQNKLNWGSRFGHLWLLPAIVRNEMDPNPPGVPFKRLSAETLQRLSALQRNETAADLNYWRPSVVLVERCSVADPCQAIKGRNFDTLAWFLQSPQFAAAWSDYRRQPASPAGFDLYLRTQ